MLIGVDKEGVFNVVFERKLLPILETKEFDGFL